MHFGDPVKITGGPFAGALAEVDHLSGNRVVIVMELRGRHLFVEMDVDWVVAASPERKLVSAVGGSNILQKSV